MSSPELIFKALNERYNDRWFSQQPAGARGFKMIENHRVFPIAVQPAGEKFTFELCRAISLASELTVITGYGVKALIQVPNPHWVGSQIIEASPWDFQGRIGWRPTVNTSASPHEIESIFADNVPYRNNPVADLPYKDGYISELSVIDEPRFLLMPNQAVRLEVLLRDERYGIEPPPEGILLEIVGEVTGYHLSIPNFLVDKGDKS